MNDMLSIALEFKDVFPWYQQRDENFKYLSNVEEWAKVEEVCAVFRVFKVATNIVLRSEYSTSNLFLPELWSIKTILD